VTVCAAGGEFQVPKEIIKIEWTVTKESGPSFLLFLSSQPLPLTPPRATVREFTPNVIEPSFGIGRILYSLLEHSYWAREKDIARGVLSLPPAVAPVKVLIVPISANAEFKPLVRDISQQFRSAGVASRVDDSSASIGKRYARNDELGTPFGVTLDFASLKNGTMTIRCVFPFRPATAHARC